MTPTLPLPLAASGFSAVITEKSRLNDEMETDGVLPDPELELALEDGVLLPLLLHAASATPAVMAAADVQLILVNRFKQITSTVCGFAAGCILAPLRARATANSAFNGNHKPEGINAPLTSPRRHKNSVNNLGTEEALVVTLAQNGSPPAAG